MEICPKAEAAGEIEPARSGQIITGSAGLWSRLFCDRIISLGGSTNMTGINGLLD
jgi:hypothetical protein